MWLLKKQKQTNNKKSQKKKTALMRFPTLNNAIVHLGRWLSTNFHQLYLTQLLHNSPAFSMRPFAR